MNGAENTSPPQHHHGVTDESTTPLPTDAIILETKVANGDAIVDSPVAPNCNTVNEVNEVNDANSVNGVNGDNAPLSIKQEDVAIDSKREETTPQVRKRKLTDPNSTRTSRASSPPWKKIAVEGPTSFVEEGKRRSARTNMLPLELQPQSTKRKTRAAQQESHSSLRSRYGSNGNKSMASVSTPTPGQGRNVRSATKAVSHQSAKSSGKAKVQAPSTTPTKRSSRRLAGSIGEKSSPAIKHDTPTIKRGPGRPRKIKHEEEVITNGHKTNLRVEEMVRSEGHDYEESEELSEELEELPTDLDFKPQRLKFNVQMPKLIPQHPRHYPAPKKFSSLVEWLDKDDPVEGPVLLSTEQVRKEARSRQRIADAIQSGSLSHGQTSLDVPEPEPEPPRQYFRHDHLVAHALDMRKRMLAERRRHAREAKKLADDLKAYWQALQPKSEEDVRREKNSFTELKSMAILRQCILDLGVKWEIIRIEVEKQRFAKWEQEQEALGKEALNKVLEQSTQLLDARIHRDSSDVSSVDEDEGEESDNAATASDLSAESSAGEQDEANMSESDSEHDGHSESAEENPDENLTLEQLRQKYNQESSGHVDRQLKDLKDSADMTINTEDDDVQMSELAEATLQDNEDVEQSFHTEQRTLRGTADAYPEGMDDSMLDESDESTDMDDDMGSSDEGSDAGDEDQGSEEDEESDPTGTLGFYFSKSDIVTAKENTPDAELEDASEPVAEFQEAIEVAVDPEPEPEPALEAQPILAPTEKPSQMSTSNLYFDFEEEEEDEVSLIPDAAEVQTSSASYDGSASARVEENAYSKLPQTRSPFDHPTTQSSLRNADRPRQTVDQSPEQISPALEEVSQIEQLDEEMVVVSPTPAEPQDHVQPIEADDQIEVPEPVSETDLNTEPLSEQAAEVQQRSPSSSPINETSQETHSAANDLESILDTNTDSLPATPGSSKPLKTAVPSLLRGTLREYQHFGLDWLAGLYANGTNGILADEMGLGKTIQTISLLAHLAVEHHVWGPHLIVVPTSVMLNWEMEFKKFLPGFKVMTYYGSPEERKQRRKGWLNDDKWNVVITSYQLVLQDQVSFKKRGWHYLVLDEAHNIKNFRSQRWQTLLSFRTAARLLLTGTPLQNNLTELWSLMFFLMPSDSSDTGIAGFAHLDEFSSWFKKPVDQILEQGRDTMDEEAKQVVKRLHSVLRPYLLRRLKADVEKQMPAKHEHVVYCKLSKRQRYLYDGFMSRASTRETLSSGNYMSIINCLMQLRKVCNHPDLFETRPIVTSFAMQRSVVADYEIKDFLVRRRLLSEADDEMVSLDAVNLLPGGNGSSSALDTIQPSRLKAIQNLRWIMSDVNRLVQSDMPFDGTSTEATLTYMENDARKQAWNDLHQKVYLTSLRSQRRPLMSHTLIDRLKVNLQPFDSLEKPVPRHLVTERLLNRSNLLDDIVFDLPSRADAMETTIQKFSCVTPNVVARDVGIQEFSPEGFDLIRRSSRTLTRDPYHESRMRLSIAFPDKRLLQYDCGKLQRLDLLLRNLQAGGHRALIFTQMTKVLDILEQFLNIHGHRYLRLDGSTKIEQRQILTDRFNNDNRILAFILSSRSGGLGINLTGADTVIFYDLDWNPAMDKQCQDRCHRIGQTRDVHIYRFVSEYTIEANILRKSNQKRMLDDVIIQEGEFTTDFFHKPNPEDNLDDETMHEADAEASAAMDRVLGAGSAPGKSGGKIFEQAEDKEDIAAAQVAEKEVQNADEADFSERTPAGGATPKASRGATPGGTVLRPAETGVDDATSLDDRNRGIVMPRTDMSLNIFEGKEVIGVDRYIAEFLEWELKDVPVGPPPGEKKKKKGGDHLLKRKR